VNVTNRSETAEIENIQARLRPPRYWLVHTFAHVLIRELAAYSGYGAASMIERIYAWEGDEERAPAAGLLIATTASDSDGTLGGLVRLSNPSLLGPRIDQALRRARRCSSDPICAQRRPKARGLPARRGCHCVFASRPPASARTVSSTAGFSSPCRGAIWLLRVREHDAARTATMSSVCRDWSTPRRQPMAERLTPARRLPGSSRISPDRRAAWTPHPLGPALHQPVLWAIAATLDRATAAALVHGAGEAESSQLSEHRG
jgi:hypothetical protein